MRISDVSIEFNTGGRRNVAVDGANLEVEPSEFICLLGPSGCGKSTLMNAVAGFVEPTAGYVEVDGKRVQGPGPERGMVFQQHSLFPWKSVRKNVAFGPRMAGHSATVSDSIARTFLGMVGLLAYGNHYPAQLSGGMQQRVGIARALANYPDVLLMDEPFGALDAQTRSMMQQNLVDLRQEFHTTIVFVTHDIEEAVFLADRVIVMSASPGRLIEDIRVDIPHPRTHEVVTDPRFVELKKQCLDLIRAETTRAFEQQGKV
ncbi:ABC transporter ATP-binding protein [Thioalkalivibrio sp. ALgr3]|uniref:ABC transporter ATP-binding protein n=1 Tax=Thioalkalivibrio sp. ALgr3 TaxID=1239292 RepID=UPI0004783D9A